MADHESDTENKQRKLAPIIVRTIIPRDTPSPADVLRKFLDELAAQH